MILFWGNVSSSSLIDAARCTFSGATVPGKTTKLRTGRIDRTSGIFGACDSSIKPAELLEPEFDESLGFPCRVVRMSALMIFSGANESRAIRSFDRHERCRRRF